MKERFYLSVWGPETVRRKGSICLYWDLRLCEGKVLSVCIGTCDCVKERFYLSVHVLGPETVRKGGLGPLSTWKYNM